MSIGIYLIRNKIDGKIYIGQSTNLEKRRRQHKNALLNKRHFNIHLQKAYEKYGDVFKFEVIEYCSIEELDEKELYWMNKFKTTNKKYGYNLLIGGTQFKKHSQESIDKIQKANQGVNNKLTINDVINIKKRLVKKYDIISIAEEYKVHKSTISKIGTCKNWSWVESNLNKKLLNRKERETILIKNEWNKCKNASEISRKTSIPLKRVCSILKEEINKRDSSIKDRNNKIINDYKKGLSKIEIMQKYNISKTSYVRITSEFYNQNRNYIISEVVKMKKERISTKEIANKLNINPSTVNRYFKKANTEVS